jgi:cellulase/cellobiase CelA1
VSSWSGAFQGELLVANTGSTQLNGWTATMTLGGGAIITQMWNATYTQSGSTVTVRPMDYNRNLLPGQNTAVGFLANVGGSSGASGSGTCTSP